MSALIAAWADVDVALICRDPEVTGDPLRDETLVLSLEDDVPLWEMTDTCRQTGLIAAGTSGVKVLGQALLDLARRGEIRILVGKWDAPEPRYASIDDAQTLLADSRRYSSAEESR
jgi:hypothetical protein